MQEVEYEVYQKLHSVASFLEQGEHDKALTTCKELVAWQQEKHPTHSPNSPLHYCFYFLGISYVFSLLTAMSREYFRAARKALKRTLELTPYDYIDSHSYLFFKLFGSNRNFQEVTAYDLGHMKGAKIYLEKLQSLRSLKARARDSAPSDGGVIKSIEDIKKDMLSHLYCALSYMFSEKKPTKEYIREAQKSIEYNPYNYDSYKQLASLFLLKHDVKMAIKIIQRWADIDKQNVLPYMYLSFFLFSEKRFIESAKSFLHLTTLYRKRLTWLTLFRDETLSERIKLYYVDYLKGINKTVKFMLYLSLGMSRWHEGFLEKAERHFSRCMEIIESLTYTEHPIIPQFHRLYGILLVDKQIQALGSAKTIRSLFQQITKLTDKVYDIVSQIRGSFEEKYLVSTYYIATSKFVYLSILQVLLAHRVFSCPSNETKDVLISLPGLFSRAHRLLWAPLTRKEINESTRVLSECEETKELFLEMCTVLSRVFRKSKNWAGVKAANTLADFVIRIYRFKNLARASNEVQQSLIRTLSLSLKYADGKSTISSLSDQELKRIVSEALNEYYDKAREKKLEAEPEKRVIKIDFSKEKKISIDSKEISMVGKRKMKQEFLLLEELVNRGEIHWTAGFVFSKNWQQKVPVLGPSRQFDIIISDLNRALGHPCVISFFKQRNIKVWKFHESIKIESSIEKAKQICEEATKIEEINSAIEKVQEALPFYPESIETNSLLIDLLQKWQGEIEGSLKKNILSAVECLRRREDNLSAAIQIIQTEADKNSWKGDWEEPWGYVKEMVNECRKVQECKIIAERLIDNVRLTDDEAKCLTVECKIKVSS
ncbi:MAG: hypothetical protein AB1393_13375 [Candidatus Edwardsbacteria bacterium]